MKYMLLIYLDEKALSEGERNECYVESAELAQDIHKNGLYLTAVNDTAQAREVELHLALYRAYNPNLGRWLSRDPIGETGGTNLYAYVSNDPLKLTDPLGTDTYWHDAQDTVAGFISGFIPGLPFDPTNVRDPNSWQPLRYVDGSGTVVTPAFVGAHWPRVATFAVVPIQINNCVCSCS